MIYWEDIPVGETEAYGRYEVTRDEVLEFARRYDPQPFHLSDEAAAKTHFGKLAASGWHTGAMAMRMIVDNLTPKKIASLGSPGLDDVRWLKPVYPGDTLSMESEIHEKREMRSRSDIGLHKMENRVLNQHGEVVMRFTSNVMTARRPAGA